MRNYESLVRPASTSTLTAARPAHIRAPSDAAATLRDVAYRVLAEEEIRQLSAIIEHSGDAIFSSSCSGLITTWNTRASELLGSSAAEMIGRPVGSVFAIDGGKSVQYVFDDALRGLAVNNVGTCAQHADGTLVRVSISASAVRSRSGEITGTSTIVRDETERQDFLARIEDDRVALVHRATHDSLTNVLNRASLHDRLESAMSVVDDDHLIALAVIGIDQFKRVNDGAGHSSGDEALRALAQQLLAGLRPTDLIARVGGDEFAVVRGSVDVMKDAEQLGREVMELLRTPLSLPNRELSLTYSVGVTLSTTGDSPESLLRDADDAMYQAKRDGKDQVIVFDQHARSRAHRRQSVAAALPQALERDELHLKYQPILDLGTLEVAGFESLLRWDHPELGTIPPDEFIPIAEATGQILSIGTWVLDHSLKQLADVAVRSTPSAEPVDGHQRVCTATCAAPVGRFPVFSNRPRRRTCRRGASRDHRERADGPRRQGARHDRRDAGRRNQRQHR